MLILFNFIIVAIYFVFRFLQKKKYYPYYSRILEFQNREFYIEKKPLLGKIQELSCFCNFMEFLSQKADKNSVVFYYGDFESFSFVTNFFDLKFLIFSETKHKTKENIVFVKNIEQKADLVIVNSKNYDLQKKICETIKPKYLLLKFDGKEEYYKGDLYTRPFCSQESNTCWLLTNCDGEDKYYQYSKTIKKWQENHRISHYNYSMPQLNGFDNCYDCWSFTKIVCDYESSIFNNGKTKEKILKEILSHFKLNLLTEFHGIGRQNPEKDYNGLSINKIGTDIFFKTIVPRVTESVPLKLRYLPKYPAERTRKNYFHHDFMRGLLLMCVEVLYYYNEIEVILIKSNNYFIKQLPILAKFYPEKKIIIYTDLKLEATTEKNLQITAFSNTLAKCSCIFFTDEKICHGITCFFSQKYCFKGKRNFIVPWSDYLYSITDKITKYEKINSKSYNYFCKNIRQLRHLKPDLPYDYCYDCMVERLIKSFYSLSMGRELDLPILVTEPPHGVDVDKPPETRKKSEWDYSSLYYFEQIKKNFN